MPSTNRPVVPPVVAGVVAVALVTRRYVAALLLEFRVDVTPELITRYTMGARFVAFALVYGLLFGVAYWAGVGTDDASDDTMLAAAAFAVATVSALAATVVVLRVIGTGTRGAAFSGVVAVGSSAAVGVQLAVVVFAGLAAARR